MIINYGKLWSVEISQEKLYCPCGKFYINTEKGRPEMFDESNDSTLQNETLEDYLSAYSEKMKEVISEIRLYAPLDFPVVIEGESGTGKEMIAKALHAVSNRSHAPFVVINMGEGPESLFESAIFGHTKGSFTGADQNRLGYIGQAKDGTVFMDEINSLPLSLQPKLLRVLEYRTYWPIGSARPEKTSAKFIFSSNQSLEELKTNGKMREDIFYRLGRILQIPPLRERIDDIPSLAEKLVHRSLRKISVGKMARPIKNKNILECPKLTIEGLNKLRSYRWPGNIRQLKMVIERAVLVCKGNEIRPEDIELPYYENSFEDYHSAMEKFSRDYFSRVEKIAGNNIKVGLTLTGMTETTYRRKMRKYGKK